MLEQWDCSLCCVSYGFFFLESYVRCISIWWEYQIFDHRPVFIASNYDRFPVVIFENIWSDHYFWCHPTPDCTLKGMQFHLVNCTWVFRTPNPAILFGNEVVSIKKWVLSYIISLRINLWFFSRASSWKLTNSGWSLVDAPTVLTGLCMGKKFDIFRIRRNDVWETEISTDHFHVDIFGSSSAFSLTCHTPASFITE